MPRLTLYVAAHADPESLPAALDKLCAAQEEPDPVPCLDGHFDRHWSRRSRHDLGHACVTLVDD